MEEAALNDTNSLSATYSPEDNKLRLYSAFRLDAETYATVKAAGFKWAPKQDLFVAPMWTPQREDLLIELCGEVGDEDTSLVDRAEERAERFEVYSDKRAQDAHNAHAAVDAIAGGIPLGQPILIGHHSERRARKDAERIESGMRKAVNMWETSKYWTSRAAGALRHAKYKESPGVRARRIKGLEADKRKQERNKADAEMFLRLWANNGAAMKRKDGGETTFLERATAIANRDYISKCFTLVEYPRTEHTYEGSQSLYSALEDGIITPEQARDIATPVHERTIVWCNRWIAHYENRIAYERARLEEQGATALLDKKSRPTQLPLCNYRAPDGVNIENQYHRGQFSVYQQIEMTKAEYAQIPTDYKGTNVVDHSHRVRTALRRSSLVCVFLTDSKVHERPGAIERAPVMPKAVERALDAPAKTEKPEPNEFDAMKAALKAGPVKVVAVPQLFPTPRDIAEQMADLADIQPGNDVLEPSAGTGNLIGAMGCRFFTAQPYVDGVMQPRRGSLTAVEINAKLAERLETEFPLTKIVRADFLDCNGDLGTFDRIIMNPPFEKGADIKHIKHALHMLRPGGVLVALCANGPRQNDELRPMADTWEKLPEGSFKSQGTGVNVAMLSIRKEA